MVEQVLAAGGGSCSTPGSPISIAPPPVYRPPQTSRPGQDDDVSLDKLTGRDDDGQPVTATCDRGVATAESSR
jgi:hypothetical protein